MGTVNRQHITMRLRADLLSKLDRLVRDGRTRDDRLSRSEIIEDAIRSYLRTVASATRR